MYLRRTSFSDSLFQENVRKKKADISVVKSSIQRNSICLICQLKVEEENVKVHRQELGINISIFFCLPLLPGRSQRGKVCYAFNLLLHCNSLFIKCPYCLMTEDILFQEYIFFIVPNQKFEIQVSNFNLDVFKNQIEIRFSVWITPSLYKTMDQELSD